MVRKLGRNCTLNRVNIHISGVSTATKLYSLFLVSFLFNLRNGVSSLDREGCRREALHVPPQIVRVKLSQSYGRPDASFMGENWGVFICVLRCYFAVIVINL